MRRARNLPPIDSTDSCAWDWCPRPSAREVQGQSGVLQARPEKWVSQADVERQALRAGGWCALEPQFQLMYAFDTLIGNDGRAAETLLFDTSEWYVYVTGHDRAFGTSRGLPTYLKARPPQPGAEMRRRLARSTNRISRRHSASSSMAGPARRSWPRRDLLVALPAAAPAAKSAAGALTTGADGATPGFRS